MLIDQLKQEHVQITEMLSRARNIDVASKEGQEFLLSVRDTLLSHLKKEEERIFPVLRDASELDEDIKRTTELCVRDMKVISKAVTKFFKKYKNGGTGTEFSNDFSKLCFAVKSRISKEESILYELYKQVLATDLKASA